MKREDALAVAVSAVVGWLVGGLLGCAIGGAAALVAVDRRPLVRHAAPGLAVTLLVIAAAATAFQGSRAETDLGSDYTAERELAGLAARTAGIITIAVLAVAVLAPTRRYVSQAEPAAVRSGARGKADGFSGWGWRHGETRASARETAERLAPMIVAAIGSGLMRIVAGPRPLSDLYVEVARNIENGVEFGRGTGFDAAATALVMPLAPVVDALAPFGGRPVLVLLGALTAAMTVQLSAPFGRRVAWVTAVLAVIAPALWGQQLPAVLATFGVTAALSALRRPRPAVGLAGLALGWAVLARPEAALAVPAVAAALWLRRLRREAVLAVLVVLAVLCPWQLWVHRNFDTWLPTTAAGPVLAGASDPGVRNGSDLGSLADLDASVPTPGTEALAQREGLASYRANWVSAVHPQVLLARSLRAWDLWSPPNAASQRADRGLPYPGGTLGGLLGGLVTVFALLGALLRIGRDDRIFWMIPGAATLGALLTFGDRALTSWAAPAALVLAALVLADLGMFRRGSGPPARSGPEDVLSGSDAELGV